MIARLTGLVHELEGNTAIIDVQGVGYQVLCSAAASASFGVGDTVSVNIYTEVKEDAIRLYGFADKLEQRVFHLLNLVKGIGPKSALEIVSKVPARDLLRFIGSGDVQKLSGLKGIGKKTAERIIVELKDKVSEFANSYRTPTHVIEKEISEPYADALLALQALGFNRKDAERALGQVTDKTLVDSGQIVRQALQFI